MILAVVYLCLSSGSCQTHDVKVEPKACHAPVYRVLMPENGKWTPAFVGIRCGGKDV